MTDDIDEPRKVYLLMEADYDGSDVKAVYASEEDANAVLAALNVPPDCGCWVFVQAFNVIGEAP